MASVMEDYFGVDLINGDLQPRATDSTNQDFYNRFMQDPRRTAIDLSRFLNRIDSQHKPNDDNVRGLVRLLFRAVTEDELLTDTVCFAPQVESEIQTAIASEICRLLKWLDPYLHDTETRASIAFKVDVSDISCEWPAHSVFPIQQTVMLWDSPGGFASGDDIGYMEEFVKFSEWAIPSSESLALAASCVMLLSTIAWTDCFPRENLRDRIETIKTSIWQQSRSHLLFELDGVTRAFDREP